MPTNVVVSSTTPNGRLTDGDGNATLAFLKWMQSVGSTVNAGFDQTGKYQGPIGTHATIAGRSTLASIVQHIGTDGIVQPAGIPSATDTNQGAVILPAGAVSNKLGSAAIEPSTSFDLAGAAAAAQAAAEAHADTVAATAQSNAENFASNASNLSSGNLPLAQLPTAGLSITITTAALTVGGTQGSMTFTNGLLTAQVQAT